jgi:hypothetical protein
MATQPAILFDLKKLSNIFDNIYIIENGIKNP